MLCVCAHMHVLVCVHARVCVYMYVLGIVPVDKIFPFTNTLIIISIASLAVFRLLR